MVCTFLLSIALLFSGAVNNEEAQSPNTPWQWHVRPVQVASGEVLRVVLVTIEESNSSDENMVPRLSVALDAGTLLVSVVGDEDLKLRPVGYRAGHRVELVHGGGVWHPQGNYLVYYTHKPEQIDAVGVEKLTVEAQRSASKQAAQDLEDRYNIRMPFPAVGSPYDLKLAARGQEPISLEQFRGKVVVIDWWATWCAPCMEKMPWLLELTAKYKDRGVVFMSISFDDSINKAIAGVMSVRRNDPLVRAAVSLGVDIESADLESALLEALERHGVELQTEGARSAVLATLESLGILFDFAEGDNLMRRIGIPWKLFVVESAEMRQLIGRANGSEALPQFFIVDPEGILRWHGYPGRYEQPEIETMLSSLSKTEVK